MGLIHMDSTLQRFWSSHSIDWMAPKGLQTPPQKTFYGPADQQNATERGHSFDPLTKMFHRTSFLVPHTLNPNLTVEIGYLPHKIKLTSEPFSMDFCSSI